MSKRGPLPVKLDGHGPLVIREVPELTERDSEFQTARTAETEVEVGTLA